MAVIHKKKFYELIAENVPNTIAKFFDKNLKILMVAGSKNFEKFGINPNDLLGKTIFEAYDADYANLHSVFWKKALEGVHNTFEADYKGKTWRYQFVPVRDDNDVIVGGMSMRQDISDLRGKMNDYERKHQHLVKIAWVTSHNLRAPLARMMGLLNIFRAEHLTAENESIIQHLEVSAAELDTMVRQIDELANYDFYVEN